MKILTIVGARPQFVKAATVSRAIRGLSTKKKFSIKETIVHTGQHYDENMSDVFFSELKIPKPDYNLKIGSDTQAVQTGKMMISLEKVLRAENPDLVMVYGDTNSTLAGAVAASKMQIPLAHVEAGLRSFNRSMPEEINRVITDHISELLFCPTAAAVENLEKEGIPCSNLRTSVSLVGDVMFDAALFYAEFSSMDWLKIYSLTPKEYILATIHRAENTDDPSSLREVLLTLADVSCKFLPIIWPMHPRTRHLISQNHNLSDLLKKSSIICVEPLSYLEMVCAEKNSRLILTDSGGVQKEAFFHGVPCITMRNETEWVELVESGWNILSGHNSEMVSRCVEAMLEKNFDVVPQPMFYGSGHSAELIVEKIVEWSKKNG